MNSSFAETLKKIRTDMGLSQQQLAEKLFVDRSSVAHWENGRRVPNAIMINRIAKIFNVDVGTLLNSVAGTSDGTINIIVVDDEKIILSCEVETLEQTIPEASITGFTHPNEALAYARTNNVKIAFTDIEMIKMNGIDFCKELLSVSPNTNVIFLTAYPDYSIDAWSTGASGFMLKPISEESIHKQLALLRYPVAGLKTT